MTTAAQITDLTVKTLPVGAAQGIARIGGYLYVYGDTGRDGGLIIECTADVEPTGREIRLHHPVHGPFTHPTGLTQHPSYGTILGNTVHQSGTLIWLDFERALANGCLDEAVITIVTDDAAHNGCRPEFVTIGDQVLLATADYGDDRPEIRLLDPSTLARADRTSESNVVVRRIPSPPFIQTLTWDKDRSTLFCIRNTTAGRGWEVDALPLRREPTTDFRGWQLPFHNELEGALRLDDRRWIFVTSSSRDNITIGTVSLA